MRQARRPGETGNDRVRVERVRHLVLLHTDVMLDELRSEPARVEAGRHAGALFDLI